MNQEDTAVDDAVITASDSTSAETESDTSETKEETPKGSGDAKPAKKAPEGVMAALLTTTPTPPVVNDLVEGTVISVEKSAVYIDLPPFGSGIIYGREFLNARDLIKRINVGDAITAKVVDAGNEEGYIELSLKEARQALVWSEAEQIAQEKRTLLLPVKEANKGGLILEWQGIQGFLPASQLKTDHYPRVEDGDKDKILEELKKLIGDRIAVTILSALPKEGKLIFSEKGTEQQEKQEMVSKYAVGDEMEGEVTGVVDFGAFVRIEDNLEGLVHISEIDWALVEDPHTLFSVGDKVRVKIIEIKDGKVSLSIKALKENPWRDADKRFTKGARVDGVIIKYNKHGALASIEEGIAGLVHISEFGSEEKLRETLELGKSYPFVITLFDTKNQRMALSHKLTLEPEKVETKGEEA